MQGGRSIEVPNRFTSEEVASFPLRSEAAEATATSLQGNGVSPGIVEGPVCVVRVDGSAGLVSVVSRAGSESEHQS